MARLDDRGDAAPPQRARGPAQARHARIMRSFARDGFLSVTEIARDIGVSPMTIRRDLDRLEQTGALVRTHGGAVVATDNQEPMFEDRLASNTAAKDTMARTAASLIQPLESVGLDVGTSILALADQIKERKDLRIVTNNVRAAMRLVGSGSRIYIPGGEVRTPELSIVGSSAIEHLRKHFLDRVFIGVAGLSELGMFDYSPEDTEVKRAFIEIADTVVVLCDSSKFGRRALAHIGALDRIDVLVTDRPPEPGLASALADAGVDVVVCPAAGVPRSS